MFVLLFRNKNINYNTDSALYSKLDAFISFENQKIDKNVQWKRGYQGLWIELRRYKKINNGKKLPGKIKEEKIENEEDKEDKNNKKMEDLNN